MYENANNYAIRIRRPFFIELYFFKGQQTFLVATALAVEETESRALTVSSTCSPKRHSWWLKFMSRNKQLHKKIAYTRNSLYIYCI